MRSLARSLPPFFVTALLLACEGTSQLTSFGGRTSAWVPDPSATIAHEYYSGFINSVDLVIVDPVTWTTTWTKLYSGLQPQPSLPDIRFPAEQIVLTALGQRVSGGFDIRIDSIVRFEHGSQVYVTTTAPGQGCATTQALTQPVYLVRISPPLREPIAFPRTTVTRNCP